MKSTPNYFTANKAPVTTCRWSKSDYEPPGGDYLVITLTNDQVIQLRYPHMIAICENQDEFKKWVQKSGIDFHNEWYFFVQLSKQYTIDMRNNQPIQTYGKIHYCLKCSQDLITYRIKEKEEKM